MMAGLVIANQTKALASDERGCGEIYVEQHIPDIDGPGTLWQCFGGIGQCLQQDVQTTIKVSGLTKNGKPLNGEAFISIGGTRIGICKNSVTDGVMDDCIVKGFDGNPGGEDRTYNISVREDTGPRICSTAKFSSCPEFCRFDIVISKKCAPEECVGEPTPVTEFLNTPFNLCQQIADPDLQQKCEECALNEDGAAAGIWTAVGCIPTKVESIIAVVVRIGLLVAGGVALLLILTSAFQLSVSQGDPKRVQEAKDIITSAIIGLIFIIFSITILQFIGVTVLHIPGFGT
ncbi:MAG: hypothetical protein GF390_02185 [Candidatus Pacebacteria bacterium]|nr:hypothetical protein [Candidatus Paceibacterota bacterium]